MISILYVDPDPVMLDHCREYLEDIGQFQVDTAQTPREALEKSRLHSYDVIISDYRVPGMDGIGFLTALRSRGDSTPFIIFTGNGGEEVAIRAFEHGADAYLRKGEAARSRLADLEQKIREAVRHRKDAISLQGGEERFREIFNKANDAIELIALQADGRPGRFIDLNEIACRVVQYTREEMLQMSPFAINTDYYSRPLEEIIRELHTVGNATFETEHKRKDGSKFPVEINTHIITLQGEKVLLSVIRDITERKQAEAALCQSNRKIKLLSRITRHDIRNLLLALDGYLVLLHEETRDPQLMDYLSKSMRISERISTMIEFTKMIDEIGIQAPSFENLHTLVDTAAGGFPSVPVRIVNDIPNDVEIIADSLMVKVFFNLIDNAIRHGTSVTSIRFRSCERKEGYVIVCEDDGTGIPHSWKGQIFEQGFGKNTGLGLFISREILAITGITIHETGEPGKGAQFEIVVPKGAYRVLKAGNSR